MSTGNKPAAALLGFLETPGGVVITPGVDGFVALVPLDEPISAGVPPIAPSLVSSLSLPPMAARVIPDGVGYTVVCPLASRRRPAVTVQWAGLTNAERISLDGFFAAEVGGTALAFDLEIDGGAAAFDDGAVVKVRPTAPVSFVPVGKGSAGVIWNASVECEQVL